MERLNTQEIEVAKELMSAGLQKAAQSLSFFMKEEITLKSTNFTTDSSHFVIQDANEYYVLTTVIKGELGGVCFLVFTPEEKNEICKVALPAEIFNNEQKLKAMQEPLLLEIDNIISASVITQLANKLKTKMYGDVPSLRIENKDNLTDLLGKHFNADKLVLEFQAEFISTKSHFHPIFIWVLEADFINRVRTILTEQQQTNG